MCCTQLAANAGPKKVAKNCHLGTIAQLCRAMSSQLRHISTIRKNLLSSNISTSSQYGELRPTSMFMKWSPTITFNMMLSVHLADSTTVFEQLKGSSWIEHFREYNDTNKRLMALSSEQPGRAGGRKTLTHSLPICIYYEDVQSIASSLCSCWNWQFFHNSASFLCCACTSYISTW